MKNTFGNYMSVTIFGESHGQDIGVILDGLKPGIEVDMDYINAMLAKRRPSGKISTARVEQDPFKISSGVFEEKTTGTPVCISIPNSSMHSKDYSATRFLARPGHADMTAYSKYHGFEDYRGGGHFSGRITAGLVAGGAIVMKALEHYGISIGTHVKKCAGVSDRDFNVYADDIKTLEDMNFPVLDGAAAEKMRENIEKAAAEGDSVGGVLETVITGMPAGVGEPFFDSLESTLAHMIFSVPAIKGIQFGAGFDFADMKGSQANDSFRMDGDKVVTATNNNGGINGGISNGMPIIFSAAVKPTPSIYKEQDTIDMSKNENAKLQIQGRHDPAIIHRAAVVVTCATAIAVYDALCGRYGTDLIGLEK